MLDDEKTRKKCEEIVEEAEGRTLKNMENQYYSDMNYKEQICADMTSWTKCCIRNTNSVMGRYR